MWLRNSAVALAILLAGSRAAPGAETACTYAGETSECAIPITRPSGKDTACVPGKVTLRPGASDIHYSVEAQVGERLRYRFTPESAGIWEVWAGGSCGGFVMNTGNFHDWSGQHFG